MAKKALVVFFKFNNKKKLNGVTQDVHYSYKYTKGTYKYVHADYLTLFSHRRNFTTDLAAQKIVRLVFNGHVLQPDNKTLAECGLFDNCVVHCLIHNQKTNSNHNQGSSSSNISGSSYGATGLPASTSGSSNNNRGNPSGGSGLGLDGSIPSDSFLNRPEHGRWYLYISLVFISLTLLFCWFCRLQYAYLFSFYSTVGLVLMSILFVAMIPLIILIERDVVG